MGAGLAWAAFHRERKRVADLAILFEHPEWFRPLFAALDRRGVNYAALRPDGDWDPADPEPPAPLVFNRLAMSSFLRAEGGRAEHPIFYGQALLDHWARGGARVVNGADVMAVDASKARQLSIVASLGLAVPRTRVIRRAVDAGEAAAAIGFPLVVKANVGGSGAGIARFDTMAELVATADAGDLPVSVDGVLLVQEYVPARDGTITRIETLDRRFLYALDVAGAGQFDLCPADACGPTVAMTAARPPAALIEGAEAIARAVGMDVGGVEAMIDDRDGTPRFYDVNALSNFVARPVEVLGWDPHDRLVDYLVERMGGR